MTEGEDLGVPDSLPGVQTVFSVDASEDQRWQADLLAFTHMKARQPGSAAAQRLR